MASVALQAQPIASPEQSARSRSFLLICWIISGVVLLIGLGRPPVSRTQEARVLETARQMLGRESGDWLIPKLNGRIRLQKPPLPYWLTAASFSVAGVTEFIGRLPFALMAWATLGLTLIGASWLFDRRIGMLAAFALLGSYLFARHMRLAETDCPATLFVTLATLAFWRALRNPRRDWMWYHLAAAGVGLAVMSKGAPGIFPILFFGAMIVIEREWRAMWRFVRSGAPLTIAIFALPWFLYVGHHEGLETFRRELWNNYTGQDHNRPLLQYIPGFLVATAPWTAIFPVAIIGAIRKWRDDPRCRALILWLLSIAVPLCFAGNRQNHYLLPLMPPAMILVGWYLDRAAGWALGTMLVLSLAPIGVLLAAARISKIGTLDIIVATLLVVAIVLLATIWRARGRASGTVALVATVALIFPPMVTIWLPRIRPDNPRALAQQILRDVGPGPFAFYGPNESLPLCFNLRQAIPMAEDPPPDVILIEIEKDGRASKTPPPAPFVLANSINRDEQVLRFYRAGAR